MQSNPGYNDNKRARLGVRMWNIKYGKIRGNSSIFVQIMHKGKLL